MEGAIRVMDGVFLGGCQAAANRRFLASNKIALVINCAPFEVCPHSSQAFCFDLNPSSSLHEKHLQIATLLASALDRVEAVLIHCHTGVSRCVGAFAAFLIWKFHWKLSQVCEWLRVVYPCTHMDPELLAQLQELHSDCPKKADPSSEEEALLINTVHNAQTRAVPILPSTRSSRPKVAWADLWKALPARVSRPLTELKSVLKGGPTWRRQVAKARPQRTDSGSTLDSVGSPSQQLVPGKAFLIGLAKYRRFV